MNVLSSHTEAEPQNRTEDPEWWRNLLLVTSDWATILHLEIYD
ncbi:hypothetical protein ACFWBF_22690 [Streptomyces sp. NPDC060028]